MKSIYQISIAHKRYDSRIYHRLACSLAKLNFHTTLIVCDGLGNENIDNLFIKDLGSVNLFFIGHCIKQFRIFLKLRKLKSILHFHEPILLPLSILLRFFGNIVIFDMHENLDLQIMTKNWKIPKFLKYILSRFYRRFENFLLKGINGVTVPQPIMVDMYRRINNNIISVANFYLDNESNYPESKLSAKNFKNLIYAGTISNERGFKNMINLMLNMPKEYKLNIAGEISEKFKKQIPLKLNRNIVLHGHLELNELKELYQICGIGLIMFNNIGQYYMSYSLKLFEYMHFGLFIVMPNFGEWNKFNSEYTVGINVDTKDSKKTAEKIKNLEIDYLKEISIRNFKNVKKHFLWENEINKLIKFYNRISK